MIYSSFELANLQYNKELTRKIKGFFVLNNLTLYQKYQKYHGVFMNFALAGCVFLLLLPVIVFLLKKHKTLTSNL